MGYKDTEWAYRLDLPMREKVVLVAYCHRTDDATHETFVGQKTVAAMLGSSEKHVSRALGMLDRLGAITRTRRTGAGGYRTSDLVRVETSYRTHSPQGSQPTRLPAHQAASPDLPDSQSRPTGPAVRAEEINQKDQPEDQPVLSSDAALAAPRPEINALLDLLDAEIIRNGSKPPSRTQKNHDAIRLMLDRDGRTVQDIEGAIRWCQADSFWRSNILSAVKLREKYDQLRLSAQRQRGSSRPTPEQRARQTYADLTGGSPLAIDPPREMTE
jgi:hypothetical protein